MNFPDNLILLTLSYFTPTTKAKLPSSLSSANTIQIGVINTVLIGIIGSKL